MKKENIAKAATPSTDIISRKDAIKKAGKYAAFTAATMFMVLSPKDSQAVSATPARPPGW